MKLFSIGTNDTKVSIALLLIRLISGLAMAFSHGLGKLQNFSSSADSFPDPFGLGGQLSMILAIFAEFFCGIFVALGFATRLTLVPLIITMATAFFVIHGSDPFAKQEMSLIYLIMYIAILVAGPGKYSIDKFINK